MPPDFQLGEQDKEWLKYRSKSLEGEGGKESPMVSFIMRTGLGKTQVYYVLFGVVIVCFFMAFQIIKNTFSPPKPVGTEDIEWPL